MSYKDKATIFTYGMFNFPQYTLCSFRHYCAAWLKKPPVYTFLQVKGEFKGQRLIVCVLVSPGLICVLQANVALLR